jgi:hypothetical protein
MKNLLVMIMNKDCRLPLSSVTLIVGYPYRRLPLSSVTLIVGYPYCRLPLLPDFLYFFRKKHTIFLSDVKNSIKSFRPH